MRKVLYISLVLFFLACQKDVQNVVSNADPVFKASFSVNGEELNLVAGQDDKYMFTSVNDDSLHIENYSGSLSNINGAKRSALSFHVRSATPDNTDLDSTFQVGEKELLSNFCGVPVSTLFKVKFNPVDSFGVTSHRWVINGTNTTLESQPVFTFDTNEVTSIPVYLHTYYNNGCMASSSRCLDFRNLKRLGDFNFEHQYNSTYKFSIPNNIMSKVDKVTWYFGSASFEGQSIFYDFSSVNSQNFVHVNIMYKDGSESCVGKNIQLDSYGAPINCNNNIDFEIEETINYDHLQLNKIEVNYWDEAGVRYSSKWGPSPGVIDIVSVEDYKINRDGKKTKQVHFKGAVTLYSLSGDEIILEDLDAIVAVAIP